jgi:hypothetical protein
MSLAHDAAIDWHEIMNDEIGAAWEFTITSPDGVIRDFVGRMSDTSQQIDPGTNTPVSGRRVVFSVSLTDLEYHGMLDIRGTEKPTEKPWKIETTDILGREHTYKAVETNPDSSIGNMVIHAEILK